MRTSLREVSKVASKFTKAIADDKPDKDPVTSGSMSLMLAKVWDPETQDPTGWLMSEKLDGVRCFWNGSTMYSRNGNKFFPPKWFKDALPKDLALDGELWTKRDDF